MDSSLDMSSVDEDPLPAKFFLELIKQTDDLRKTLETRTHVSWNKGFCKDFFFSKNPILLWKWVGGSRSHPTFLCGTSSKNSHKPVLIYGVVYHGYFLSVHC